MYCSTICFHRRRQSQPRKKLWTFFILAMSGSSLSLSYSDGKLKSGGMDDVKRIKNSVSYLFRPRYCFCGITLHSFFRVKSWKLIIIWRQCHYSVIFIYMYTSSRSFFISIVRSSQCFVYCHFAVFSLSTTFLFNQASLNIRNLSNKKNINTCSKWRCFCSSSSFCNRTLLKLNTIET